MSLFAFTLLIIWHTGINGEWPCPPLHVDIGDKVVIHVTNSLGNQSTSLHWHGMYQEGTTHMDGASQVSQCPIPPGRSFTYEFYVKQPGTYWYHAHIGAQYSDGLRAPLIVHDRGDPFNRDFDEEYTLTLSGKDEARIKPWRCKLLNIM